MGFFGGMIVGIAIGIGLIIGFARHESVRSKRRSDLAKTIAAFARMTVEDSRKLLPPKFYPSWVVFTRRQKLNWLNVQLRRIWPHVDEAVSELIKTNVEPILEQYRPVVLASLSFSKLTLGTVAPQFTGVTILEENSGPDGVTMDLEMQWDGNPNIVLDIKTRVGVVLPVQVKDIGFTGVFRLIFKPLVNEFPGFGAVCFSLKEKKDLDFTLKVIGGDLSALPGVSDAIEETIRDAIEDSITWPVRQIIPILPGDYSNLELKPVGILEVKLVQAKNLTNKDLIGKSDPYAVLFVRPLRARTKTSKVVNNQLSPIWNEHFEFTIEDAATQHLTVRIFDDEGLQASELIGCAQVSLQELEPGKVKDVWLKLVKDLEIRRDNKYRGEVHLELLYCPIGMESTIKNPFDPDISLTSFEKTLKSGETEVEDPTGSRKRSNVIVRGVLSVTVISAEDLPVVDLMGKADPFVVLSLKKTEKKLKTRVVNESLNPVWNQTFDFVVEDGLHEMLILEVYDHDTFGKEKIGRVILTLTKVILEGEYNETYPLDGAKSGSISLYLKWTPQHKFRDT
ncbi:synaptotagmin-4 [Vigna radiata var. radiata]|uniref:Synaptotagmin-4 n=1 Tax=Vigna radiata var. radiata TaxID=3916 RepID=A0A3Q0EWA4_VIGRR|nr:synaptotagmin-4 [Vigna radiata var. radiata]